jgi:serine/threonine protein kinase
MLARGARLGKYEIVASLGSGGMGDVYRALDPRLEREVAIKVIRSLSSNTDAQARLWREARAAASVSHPGICQIYDVGESDEQLFIVMELLNGQSLSSRLKDGPLKPEEAVTTSLGILGALGALHSRQIVHRDLKPSNVFLIDGGIKLLDFGLARSRYSSDGAEQTITQTGMVVGTPRYMAPEQWSQPTLDPRSDLFAAGAILFEMLSGQPAFPGNDLMQVYHAVMSGHPAALTGSTAVTAIDGVIHRALEKRPEDRYQTAEAMAQALRSALTLTTDTSTVTVRPTTRLIAIPFRMLRPDPEVEFLSFSLPDAIMSSLAGVQTLVVRSTMAGSRYANDDAVDLKKIGAEAGVDAVLCGTLLRAVDKIRVTAQLLEASSGTILWSKTIQVELKDIFDVQDQLAKAIVESLSIPLSSGDQRRLRKDLPASARAYEFYLRANQLAHDSSMLPVAAELYQSALAEDPNYAPAWARLGRVYRVMAKYGTENVNANLEQAEHAFRRALEINPDSSIAHNYYTNFEVESLGRAKEAMARLLGRARSQSADPELFAGLVLACRFCGLLDASLAAHRQARRLDPHIRTSVMYTNFMRGEWERAVEADYEELQWVTNWTLPLLGRTDEAIANYRRILQQRLPPMIGLMMGAACAVLEDNRDGALGIIREFMSRNFDPEGCYFMARNLVRLGEHASALDLLERLVKEGFFAYQILQRDPWLDPIRSERRFNTTVAHARERSQDAEAEFHRLGGDQLLSNV